MHVLSRRARLNPWKMLRSAAGAFDLPSILVGVVVQLGPRGWDTSKIELATGFSEGSALTAEHLPPGALFR